MGTAAIAKTVPMAVQIDFLRALFMLFVLYGIDFCVRLKALTL
jgi:hypothetical protein